MPRGCRYVIVAAFGWLALAAANRSNETRSQNASAQKIAPLANVSVAPITHGYQPNTATDQPGCGQRAEDDNFDPCVQWRATVAAEQSAYSAKLANYVAGAGAVLSFISILLVLDALRQARKTNRIAMGESGRSTRRAISTGEETAEALRIARVSAGATAASLETFSESNKIAAQALFLEQRAWLYPSITSFERILFNDHGVQVDFHYKIKNHGRTHANLIFNNGYLVSNNMCNFLNEVPLIADRVLAQGATLVFPEEIVSQGQLSHVRTENLHRDMYGNTRITIFILIFYKSVGSDEIRRTVRAYDVYDTNEYGNVTSLIFGKDIPPNASGMCPVKSGTKPLSAQTGIAKKEICFSTSP